MKVLLDSNVIVAAFAAPGLCHEILELCLTDYELVTCEHILEETRRILKAKIKLPEKDIADIISLLKESSTMVTPASLTVPGLRDPDDLAIIAAAVAGDAEYLVTGDKDLLCLGHYGKLKILSPRDFIARL